MRPGLGTEGVEGAGGAARWRKSRRGAGGAGGEPGVALTFALFARGLGASRRHLFAGCGASRLITLPAA